MTAIKFGKLLMNAIVVGLLISILIFLVQENKRAPYVAAPLEVTPGPMVSAGPTTLFGLQAGLQCIPGPSETAAYYTVGLNAEGLCGDGDWVNSQMRDYTIENGVGGSLLEK